MSSAHKYTWTRKDGSIGRGWRAKWTGVDGKPRTKRGFDLQGAAEDYAADREVEARHGVTLSGERPSGKTTVEVWAKTWLAAQEVRPSSAASYGYAVKRINRTLGARSLTSLRQSELRAWRRGLRTTYAETTAEQTAAVLSMILRAAVHDGLLQRSPMPPAKGGAGGRIVDPNELLTIEQVHRWGSAMTPAPSRSRRHPVSPAVAVEMPLVAAQTGLRLGELLGLEPSNVDFLRRLIRVEHQLLPNGRYGPPKSPAAVRTVPLTEDVAAALNRHLVVQPARDGEPIFRGPRGRRWTRSGFWQVWHDARVAAELPEWVTWHSLRDVYASSLIFAGEDLRVVMTLMGHASSEETLRTYTRLWPTATDSARRSLERLWRPSEGQEGTTGS